ncbi:hypothetical protein CELD12_12120 [Cellulomonas sp. NTE-D12]|nr:hypothetical protein CELD12_12120 [Cellulomonas sp. NTE-D12]
MGDEDTAAPGKDVVWTVPPYCLPVTGRPGPPGDREAAADRRVPTCPTGPTSPLRGWCAAA